MNGHTYRTIGRFILWVSLYKYMTRKFNEWTAYEKMMKKFISHTCKQLRAEDADVVRLSTAVNAVSGYFKVKATLANKTEADKAIELDLQELMKRAKKSTKPDATESEEGVHPTTED